jgi:hypothetical protein
MRSLTISASCLADVFVAEHWLTKRFATSEPTSASPFEILSIKALEPLLPPELAVDPPPDAEL